METFQLHEYKPRGPVPKIEGAPGEMGQRVQTPAELLELKKEKFKINQFNLVVSDMVSVNRSLRDVRMEACKVKTYPRSLPSTSVIIVFHNEAWSTLLRSLHSIINRSAVLLIYKPTSTTSNHPDYHFILPLCIDKNRSPVELLHEIILVDDASSGDNHAHLGSELEDYVARLSVPVKIVRSSQRFVLDNIYPYRRIARGPY